MAFECMEDCIHLKACRRVQAIGKTHRLMVPRYCDKDCTAYRSGDDVVKEIEGMVDFGFSMGKKGNDWVEWNNKEQFKEWLRGEEI